MRAAICLLVLLVACSAGRPAGPPGAPAATNDAGSETAAPTGPAPDAGASPDSGSPGGTIDVGPRADAGPHGDAGPVADAGPHADAGPAGAGPAADAGAPGTIAATACPASPALLWSRTFSDEVDFRGAADGAGNLYWIEYDPPPTSSNPNTQAFLVSADRDGRNRYRLPVSLPASFEGGVFLLAGNTVVLSSGAVLAGYAAATGAFSWLIDLRATYPDRSAVLAGIADLGNGELAFAVGDFNVASGLYLADATTGSILSSRVATSDVGYRVLGSNGAGSAVVTANPSSSYSEQLGYHTAVDVLAIDSSGQTVWSHRIADGGNQLLGWFPGAPWLAIGAARSLSPAGDYLAAPGSWFNVVEGSALQFALSFGSTAATPVAVNVIRNGAVIASGPIAGTNTYDGVASWPFLAGASGDHLVLLSQNWHASPGLCHPSRAGTAALSRFDASASYQCPLTFAGESGIEGAALLPDRLVLGRRTYLTDACTQELQPVTIEAYALPGEALAPSGWVQPGGNPGLGSRPR